MTGYYRGSVGAENRRYPRVRLKLWVKYKRLRKGEVTGPHESRAEDLGARGLAMRSAYPMKLGQLLMLTLYLPPENKRPVAGDEVGAFTEAECLPVDILARVVWCAPRDEKEFMLGIQFLDPDPGHRSRLKSLLIEYNLDQPDSALYT